MTPSIATFRPWHQPALDALLEALRRAASSVSAAPRAASLHELDAGTLRDIGVDASEIASIEAESRGAARVTRLEAPKRRIRFGLLAGKLTIPQDFDAPLPAEVLERFVGR